MGRIPTNQQKALLPPVPTLSTPKKEIQVMGKEEWQIQHDWQKPGLAVILQNNNSANKQGTMPERVAKKLTIWNHSAETLQSSNSAEPAREA